MYHNVACNFVLTGWEKYGLMMQGRCCVNRCLDRCGVVSPRISDGVVVPFGTVGSHVEDRVGQGRPRAWGSGGSAHERGTCGIDKQFPGGMGARRRAPATV